MGYYNADKKDGRWQEWDINGSIKINGTYNDGNEWDGIFNSSIYSNGIKAIPEQDHYDSGNIKEEGLVLGENKIGKWTYWHENGEKKAEGNISNDKKDGIWTYWYKSGLKEKSGNYRNDHMHGEWSGWYFSGKKFFIRNYDLGKKHGIWIWWYSNGAVSYTHLRAHET